MSVIQNTNPNFNRAIQDFVGNTDINFSDTSVTADEQVYTVTASKTLYLTDLTGGLAVTTGGVVYIRDGAGGTIMDTFITTSASNFNIIRSYSKPKKFSVGVYFDVVSGSYSSGNLTGSGYEK